MAYPPAVMTKKGHGHLFKIDKNKALVEFDYMYLVELPLDDVDLTGVDLQNVEVEKERGDEDEGPLEI